jgi:hypothetical protein
MARPKQGYRNAAGEKVPGTTTIIGRFKDSGALIQWAYKQGRLHEDMSHRGIPNAPAYLYDAVDKAAASGTVAHDLIEHYILKAEILESDDKNASNAFAQFRHWLEQSRLRIVDTERPYVSEKYQFGGTIDALGEELNGDHVLVDWKTSNAVYTDYLIQLAAYALLLEECNPGPPIKGFHLLRIAKESADFTHHYFGELEDAKRAFILMRELYDLDGELKKRVK